ncbi:MAG: hypothetical protein ACTHLL_08205 [Candidatus Nitrosocosmicus sp.]
MKNQVILIGFAVIIFSMLLVGAFQHKSFSVLTKSQERNLIGFALGCQDGLAGKSPDKAQYDARDWISNHTADYNIGYFNGYNSCSTNQKIG